MINMSRNGNDGKTGLGVADVLLIIFIVLKLCGLISWSWVWVLSPLWISIILGIILYLLS